MKHQILYLYRAVFALSVLLLVRCQKDDPDPGPGGGGGSTISITSVNPSAGAEGSKVVITGSGFSSSVTGNEVKFGTVAAKVDSASVTRIVTTVPKGGKSGKVTVTVGGKSGSSGSDFTVSTVILPEFSSGGNSFTVSTNGATVSSSIATKGAVEVTQHGHVWSKANNLPTVADSKTELGKITETATFPFKVSSELKNLEANTTYFIRPYFMANAATVYGEVVVVKTEEPQSQSPYVALADLPFSTTNNLKFLTVGNRLFAVSFTSGEGYPLYEYDLQQNKWIEKAAFSLNANTTRRNPYGEMAVINGKIYTIANLLPNSSAYLCVYDPATNLWAKAFESPLTGLAATGVLTFAANGKLYIFGGDYSTKMVEIDVEANRETKSTDFPMKNATSAFTFYTRGGFAANDKIYIVVSLVGQANRSGLYEYDPKTAIWTEKSQLSASLGANYERFVVSQNKAHALLTAQSNSGVDKNGQLYSYDFIKNEWSKSSVRLLSTELALEPQQAYMSMLAGYADGRMFIGGGSMTKAGIAAGPVKKFFEFKLLP